MQPADQVLNLDPVGLSWVMVRTLAVYGVLLVLLRLFGKRELGQMAPFDLVVLLIISNAVQNAMVGPDTSLTGGLLAAATLLMVNRLIDRMTLRFAWLRHFLRGTPTVLVQDGELVAANMQLEDVSEDDVLQAAREHGVEDISGVKLAELEVDGTISIIPIDAPRQRPRHRVRGRKPSA